MLELVKLAVSFVTSASVGAVIKNVIAHNVNPDAKFTEKVLMGIGTVIISSMLGGESGDYVNQKLFPEKKEDTDES